MNDEPTCKFHPKAPIVEDFRAGDLVCRDCGRVVGDRVVDVGTEWRNFGNSDKNKNKHDPSRVGAAEDPLLDGGELSTRVSELKNATLPWAQWQHRSNMTSDTRSLKSVFKQVEQLGSRMKLADATIQVAKQCYKMYVSTGKASKGNSHLHLAAGAIYLACKKKDNARSVKEVATYANCTPKALNKVHRAMAEVLKAADQNGGSTVVDPSNYVKRWCSKLGLQIKNRTDTTSVAAAVHIVKAIKVLGLLEGKSPQTVAAVAIHLMTLVSGYDVSFQAIKAKTGASEAAIKGSYKVLYPYKHYLFPQGYKFTSSLCEVPLYGYKGPNPDKGLARAARLADEGKLYYTDGLPQDNVAKYEAAFEDHPAAVITPAASAVKDEPEVEDEDW
eukprot:TRINITY_DN7139_c0_g3_i1.p1 TRINITY_DN7139_c0_g3~~TRINITY_DN7139_c0_g3_i1.p1  ORF type:complete len:387 (+),score=109.26 TRINITY_DN7139_c0_g3_i1:128-1288(+)